MKMLPRLCGLLLLFACLHSAEASSGKVIKVLPEFLDTEGRASLSPSLYERDAYQAELRLHPEKRSGLRFYIEWKSKGPHWQPLKLKLELRGRSTGNMPEQLVLEQPVENKRTVFTRWADVTLTKEQYQHLGTVTAWKVTLWEGQTLLGEQQSFLW